MVYEVKDLLVGWYICSVFIYWRGAD